jgi:polar amino acid transport system substrate-binding protein
MRIILACLIILTPFCGWPQSLENIQWYSEIYLPNNYLDEKGVARGFMVDILLEVWKEAGLKKTRSDIKFIPWSRGLRLLETNSNICLFGMAITEERQKKYRFIGPVLGAKRALIAKKGRFLKFNSMDEANKWLAGKKVGVVREDIGETLFLKKKGRKDSLIRVSRGILLARMIHHDRIHMVSYNLDSFMKTLKQAGYNPHEYESVYLLEQGRSGYSFNRKVNPAVLRKLQRAFDRVNQRGDVQRIRNRYINGL